MAHDRVRISNHRAYGLFVSRDDLVNSLYKEEVAYLRDGKIERADAVRFIIGSLEELKYEGASL